MSCVWVLNASEEPLLIFWDGKSYEFLPGKQVEAPEIVARQCLGYLDKDKEPYLVRLGWVKVNTDVPEAAMRLARIKISAQPFQDHHYQSPVVGRIPLPPSKGGGGKGTAKVA